MSVPVQHQPDRGRRSIVVAATIALVVTTIGGAFAETTCPLIAKARRAFGPTTAVAVMGETAFVSSGELVKVFDTSDPGYPVAIGEVTVGELPVAMGVDESRGILFCATAGELVVVDISLPAEPTVLGRLLVEGALRHIAVAEGLAFLADESVGLRIIDTVDPAAPAELAVWPSPGIAIWVAVHQQTVYLADFAGGLRVLDVSNPSSPSEIGSWSSEVHSYVLEVSVTDDIACATVWSGGSGALSVIDVSNPGAPKELSSYVMVDVSAGLATSGPLAFVAEAYGGGVHVIDLSNPVNPVESKWLPKPHEISSLAASDNRLIVGMPSFGADVNEIPADDLWYDRGSIETAGRTLDVAIAGETIYAAGGGLTILDWSEQGHLEEVGVWENGSVKEIEVGAGVAYLLEVGFWAGLRLVDVSHTASPAAIAYLGQVYGNDLVLTGTHLLIPAGFLRIVDVTDPMLPVELSPLDMDDAERISVVENTAYVITTPSLETPELVVVNIEDFSAPFVEAALSLPCFPADVAAIGDLAFVGCSAGGVISVDVTNSTAPAIVGILDEQIWVRRLEVAGNRLYVLEGWYSDHPWGLRVLDVSNPTSTQTIALRATADRAEGLGVGENLIVVGDGDHGVSLFSQGTCFGYALRPMAYE